MDCIRKTSVYKKNKHCIQFPLGIYRDSHSPGLACEWLNGSPVGLAGKVGWILFREPGSRKHDSERLSCQ